MKKLTLSRLHLASGAKMVEYAGWEMPIQYSSISEEHMAVREAAGLFDISHMGEFMIKGPSALDFLQKVTTNDVSRLTLGGAHYSTVLNENGGTKDDVVIYRFGEKEFMLVCNAANVDKIKEWFKLHLTEGVSLEDITMSTVLLAVQGPKAQSTLQGLANLDLAQIKRFKAAWADVSGTRVWLSRSGYTGEDGFELYILDVPQSQPAKAERLWEALLNAGKAEGLKPCGLGTRDTTRLEAGLCLYGNDLSEEITPLEAKIGFAVKFDKGDFIGREALLKQKESGVPRVRVGLRVLDAGIPRKGYSILKDGKEIGRVSSGTFSPLLNVGIAMGYVTPTVKEGDQVTVEIHGSQRKAEIASWPFYDTEKYGYARSSNA